MTMKIFFVGRIFYYFDSNLQGLNGINLFNLVRWRYLSTSVFKLWQSFGIISSLKYPQIYLTPQNKARITKFHSYSQALKCKTKITKFLIPENHLSGEFFDKIILIMIDDAIHENLNSFSCFHLKSIVKTRKFSFNSNIIGVFNIRPT